MITLAEQYEKGEVTYAALKQQTGFRNHQDESAGTPFGLYLEDYFGDKDWEHESLLLQSWNRIDRIEEKEQRKHSVRLRNAALEVLAYRLQSEAL